MLPPPQPSQPPAGPEPTGTLLETDDDILQAMRSKANVQLVSESAQPATSLAKPPASTSAYRPTQRPLIAILTVFDDGKSEGESLRLWTDRFVVGRSEGDFLLPHDAFPPARLRAGVPGGTPRIMLACSNNSFSDRLPRPA